MRSRRRPVAEAIAPALLDSQQTDAYLGTSPSVRERLQADGKFVKPIRLGTRKALRWSRAALDEWIEMRNAEAQRTPKAPKA